MVYYQTCLMTIKTPFYTAKILWHKEITQISPNVIIKAQEYSIKECDPPNFLDHHKHLYSFNWIMSIYQVRAEYTVVNEYYVTPYYPEQFTNHIKESLNQMGKFQILTCNNDKRYRFIDQVNENHPVFLALKDNVSPAILAWDTEKASNKWISLNPMNPTIWFKSFKTYKESLTYMLDQEGYEVYQFNTMNELFSYIHLNIDLNVTPKRT